MSKGKHSASVNAVLRQQLHDSDSEVRHLESQIGELRRQLAVLEAWKANVISNGLPALNAERARADAALAAVEQARLEERKIWTDRCDASKATIRRLIRLSADSGTDAGMFDEPGMIALADMYGDVLAAVRRIARRNAASGASIAAVGRRLAHHDALNAAVAGYSQHTPDGEDRRHATT